MIDVWRPEPEAGCRLCIVSPSRELIVVRLGGSAGGVGGVIGSSIAADVWGLVPSGDLPTG